MISTKIKIANLYKIFGSNSKKYIPEVRDGMSKDELLSKYNHVLGLDNINLKVEDQSIQVVMGLSGSGKSTLIRHINRLIEHEVLNFLCIVGLIVARFPKIFVV